MSERPLRIGLLMHSLNPRGGVVHTLELADALVARGHHVTVLTSARPGQRLFRACAARLSVAPLADLPAELVPMVGARMAAMAAHLRQLPELVDFDILHSQDSITANALATLQDEGRIHGYVRTVHHLDEFVEPQLTIWQARGVNRASLLLCVSDLWQRVLAHDWGRSAERIHNGVNLTRFHAHVTPVQHAADQACLAGMGVQVTGPVWLTVGGVEERKNTARLLQAFVQACEHVPDAQLVIAGGASLLAHDAEAQAFQRIRQANGMAPGQARADRLILTGAVPDETLQALYRRASALVMPSLREGFGLAAIESLACGTPAIVSRRAPFTEHLEAHEALWVDPFDTSDIAQALCRSLDPEQTEPVRTHAPDVCARFNWAHSAARHAQIYQQHLICHA